MNSTDIQEEVAKAVEMAKKTTPLSPSITNTVTINFVANAQLAVGGSAAMIYLPDEGVSMAKLGGSMYINVGTLMPIYEETVPKTMKALHALHTPWVLDPVAIGVGKLRTKLLLQAKEAKPSIIRGNASEIIALAGLWELTNGHHTSNVRGVDSTDTVMAAKEAAQTLARWTGGAVAVSGEEDLITDGVQIVISYGGSPMMTCVTGCGCSLGGVMAVYAAVAEPFIAAITGAAIYNLAGKKAAAKADGTGSFQQYFLDELYKAAPQDVSMNPFTVEEE